MSSPVSFARHEKLRTDRAISSAYAELRTRPLAMAAFAQLLAIVRERSSLLDASKLRGLVRPQIDALRNLARFAQSFLRPPDAWQPLGDSRFTILDSLAQHLLARYPVPRFMASVWCGGADAYSDTKRVWFVAHASGQSFRSLALPMVMTRRMEGLFLRSPDHFDIEPAMRQAELRALGASRALVDAVLATPVGSDLRNGCFWRSVWLLLVRESDALDLNSVGPIIDFLDAIRHRQTMVEQDGRTTRVPPAEPHFSLAGRTLRSLMRRVEVWHGRLAASGGAASSWAPSRYTGWRVREASPPEDADRAATVWEFVELTNSEELREEGWRLRHCVASYATACVRGRSRIWSLRRGREPRPERSVLTIEVDPGTRFVVQARGFANARASGRPRRLLEQWARREGLAVSKTV